MKVIPRSAPRRSAVLALSVSLVLAGLALAGDG